MKKTKHFMMGTVFGITIACTVAFSSNSFAAISNFVGAKIQGEFTVLFNGKKLEDKAIVVNGKSFLPVAKISKEMGLNVSVDNKVIKLNSSGKNVESNASSSQNSQPVSDDEAKKMKELQLKNMQEIIDFGNDAMEEERKSVKGLEEYLENNKGNLTETEIEATKNKIKQHNENINKYQKTVDDTEKQREQILAQG